MGYRTIIARSFAKWGIAQMCLCETMCQGRGVSQHFGGNANLPQRVSHDMGYRSDSIAISHDMGPLRWLSDPRRCACLVQYRPWLHEFVPTRDSLANQFPNQTYIYIYAVGSITWPFFGQSRVNNLAMVGSITWPSFFEPIKIGFLGVFWCTVFRGCCKISVLEKKIGQKRGFRKKIVHLFLGGVLALLPCCCMMALDALEGCATKPYKNRFLLSTLLPDAEETEKEKKKPKKVTPKKWGALKTGRK